MADKPPDNAELERLRAAMDACNLRLAAVLHERAQLALEIGRCKRALGLGVADPEREAAMLAEVAQQLPADGFSSAALESIFTAVFRESRRLLEREARSDDC